MARDQEALEDPPTAKDQEALEDPRVVRDQEALEDPRMARDQGAIKDPRAARDQEILEDRQDQELSGTLQSALGQSGAAILMPSTLADEIIIKHCDTNPFGFFLL